MSRKDHRRYQPSTAPRVMRDAPVAVEPPRSRSAQQRQQFLVRIENMRSQALDVSILDESGAVQGVRLTPRGKSHPIAHDRVGTYTRDLERQGHVRIVPES